ncbi:peptidase S24-like protein [archaeon BMS3Abin16]|nr:peptidase S24-like protein [archaeon BMS3Abin16]HDY74612.1 signal peptidase I [Euryarchaeota archaeon]
MVFQYQYQYQYQLQRGLGLTTYDSFSRLIQDTYSNPVLLSLLVALVPLLFFFLRNRHPPILKYFAYLLVSLPVFLLTKLTFTYSREGRTLTMIVAFIALLFYLLILYEYWKWKNTTPEKQAKELFEEDFLQKKTDYLSFFIAGFTILVGVLILTQSLFFVAVTSNSMAPVFWESDLVLIQAISNNPKVGDIAVFQNPGVNFDDKVIHRIFAVRGDDVITKGDNNNYPDDWVVDRGSVLGTAITYNGRPIVAKKIGRYFIRDYGLDKGYSNDDPTYQMLSWSMSNIHSYGPIYLVVIVLLIFITMLERPDRGKVY